MSLNKYIVHVSLTGFAQSLFFSFGTLLIYNRTESIILTILFNVISLALTTLLRSVFAQWYLKIIQRLGISTTCILGMILSASSYVLLYFMPTSSAHFTTLYVLSAVFLGLGDGLYWPISNALKYQIIGASDKPGVISARIDVFKTAAALLAALLGVLSVTTNQFSVLFVVGAVLLIIGGAFLVDSKTEILSAKSYKGTVPKISPRLFFAHFAPHYRFQGLLLPLVLLILFVSLDMSVWIVALTSLGSIVVSLIVGESKDMGLKLPSYIAALGLPAIWIIYSFSKLPWVFIVAGILYSLFTTIIVVGRNAITARIMYNENFHFDRMLSVEFARSLGGLTGALIILLLYQVVGDLKQWFLLIAAVLSIYPAFFTTQALEQKRS